ncbi:endospore germination permease [Paenibacillus sp. MMS20-IR301]|uniref:GerAB/ArcD/ProY family transporter n=1 Tax=Paenibacillus sp. MMS20-IR301 TaxID=2895946 RepID=UPI0028EF8E73|nr:endospore germination permease [Paenibacillus sp. MMS20-IR301]WNS41164.1 endospore germination permease [Paenibacillus sp. MMS20-IR301]
MNGKIGTTQASLLIVNTILPTATIVLPVIITNYSEQDAPLAIFMSTAAGLLVAAIVGTVIRNSNGAPFLDWVREKTSPVVAVILGLFMLQFYLDTTATILREFVNFIKDNVLIDTPVTVLVVLILLITIYMVRQGLESIARVNTLVILLYFVFLPLYLFGLFSDLNVHYLLPMFDHTLAEITLASLTPATWMSEVAVLLFLAPYLQYPQRARIIGWAGLIFVSVLMMFSLIIALMVFGPDFIKLSAYPGFSTVSIIRIGRFIEKLDSLFIAYWVLSIYLKVSIFLFVTVECFKQTFRVSSSRPFIGALGLLIALECLFSWQSSVKLNLYNKEGRYLVFLLFNVLVPLGAVLLNRVRKAKRKGAGT